MRRLPTANKPSPKPTGIGAREAVAPCDLIGGLVAVAAIFVVGFFNPFATKLGSLGFANLSVDGTKIVMDRPKLAGFRSDKQPYLLTAERALQDIKHPTVVELRSRR